MLVFAGVTDLISLLGRFLPEEKILRWGGGGEHGMKTVSDLFGELQLGESTLRLADGKITRQVQVVCLFVFKVIDGKTYQFTEVGRIRGGIQHARVVEASFSEKMYPKEEPLAVLARLIEEEQPALREFTRVVGNPTRSERTDDSGQSYPGLTTHYELYKFKTWLFGLADLPYERQEGDVITLYKWVEVES